MMIDWTDFEPHDAKKSIQEMRSQTFCAFLRVAMNFIFDFLTKSTVAKRTFLGHLKCELKELLI